MTYFFLMSGHSGRMAIRFLFKKGRTEPTVPTCGESDVKVGRWIVDKWLMSDLSIGVCGGKLEGSAFGLELG